MQIGVCKVDISHVFHDDISLSPSSQKLRDSILDDQMILDDYEKSVKNVSNSKKGKMEELANELSQVTPLNTFHEDGEYAFYRNILEDDNFPFQKVFESILPKLKEYFQVDDDDLRLDDAFCIMYDAAEHDDTTGKKHMDPSDITVNICLQANHVVGSGVMFYGRRQLHNVRQESDTVAESEIEQQYIVPQDPGYATIHHGGHWHQTLEMTSGRRTNVVLTYCYKDIKKSNALSRNCY